ncbi:MAG: DUF2905 domain-containing protein [Pyrinomonas sp.]|uniref:DUF2905 domain-containing protein n=1 Tax=Pyrinomonas sp. TaxID=2080306 RepID=UPI003325D11D
MDQRSIGQWIVLIGVFVVLIGLLIWSGALWWFGKLPGDFRYESGSVRIYFPFASMLLVSLILSLLFQLVRRFF